MDEDGRSRRVKLTRRAEGTLRNMLHGGVIESETGEEFFTLLYHIEQRGLWMLDEETLEKLDGGEIFLLKAGSPRHMSAVLSKEQGCLQCNNFVLGVSLADPEVNAEVERLRSARSGRRIGTQRQTL